VVTAVLLDFLVFAFVELVVFTAVGDCSHVISVDSTVADWKPALYALFEQVLVQVDHHKAESTREFTWSISIEEEVRLGALDPFVQFSAHAEEVLESHLQEMHVRRVPATPKFGISF
jgi:hypothetical protein